MIIGKRTKAEAVLRITLKSSSSNQTARSLAGLAANYGALSASVSVSNLVAEAKSNSNISITGEITGSAGITIPPGLNEALKDETKMAAYMTSLVQETDKATTPDSGVPASYLMVPYELLKPNFQSKPVYYPSISEKLYRKFIELDIMRAAFERMEKGVLDVDDFYGWVPAEQRPGLAQAAAETDTKLKQVVDLFLLAVQDKRAVTEQEVDAIKRPSVDWPNLAVIVTNLEVVNVNNVMTYGSADFFSPFVTLVIRGGKFDSVFFDNYPRGAQPGPEDVEQYLRTPDEIVTPDSDYVVLDWKPGLSDFIAVGNAYGTLKVKVRWRKDGEGVTYTNGTRDARFLNWWPDVDTKAAKNTSVQVRYRGKTIFGTSGSGADPVVGGFITPYFGTESTPHVLLRTLP